MSSIDRYCPPKEGYQPPTVPATSRNNEPPLPVPATRSPGRRRDVPPAVPTPPRANARLSPPRSNPRGGHQQSPVRSGGQTPLPPASQWFFTPEETESTPSIADGVQPADERMRRAKGVNFIYQAGVMLDLPQITLWVAGVFFHRFYMRVSMEQDKGGIHHYNIAATALFLANKVEENCRKTKEVIIAVARVAQKNAKLVIDEQSKEYWRWRDSILTYEELMLEQLTFDLMVDNPYRHLFELLGQLDIVHNKHLRQSAWAFCNDACLTVLPLLIDARDVAIASIFFATVHTGQKIDDVDGQAWWKYLNGDEHRCARAMEVMRQFYTENPLRKTNPQLPSPAYHLENTRRRADESAAGTPMDVDRAISRSPGRMNGSNGKDTDMRDQGVSQGGSSQAVSASASAPPPPQQQPPPQEVMRSPSKRRDMDVDSEPDKGRAEKRAKVSEDEGEYPEE